MFDHYFWKHIVIGVSTLLIVQFFNASLSLII